MKINVGEMRVTRTHNCNCYDLRKGLLGCFSLHLSGICLRIKVETEVPNRVS